MLKLFKIEWAKLFPSRAFRVLIGIYTVVFGLFMIILNRIGENFEPVEELFQLDYNPFVFPDIWIITFWLARPFVILPAIVVIALTVNEFQFRTGRQHVIDGLSRWEFIMAKFGMVKFMAFICTAIVFIMATLVGLSNSGGSSPTGMGTTFIYLLAFYIRTLGLLTFAMFLAIWIKRTGVSILFFIVLHMGFIAMWLKFKLEGALGPFMPVGAMNRLVRVPFGDVNEESIGDMDSILDLKLTDIILSGSVQEMLMVVLYICIFLGLSYYVIKKKDMK